MCEDRNDYSVWATQWPTVQASLHGFIVHELLKHNTTAIHHCAMFKRHGCAISNADLSEGRVWTCWDALVSYICAHMDMPALGFLCAPCSRWVFEEKKAHPLFFLIICCIWIPTLIGSILLAYKLDPHRPWQDEATVWSLLPFWTIDAIIFLASLWCHKFSLMRKQLKQNAAVENARISEGVWCAQRCA